MGFINLLCYSVLILGQSDDVFSYHEEEFMKPVIDVCMW